MEDGDEEERELQRLRAVSVMEVRVEYQCHSALQSLNLS